MNIDKWLKKAAQRIISDSPQLDAELLLAERIEKSRSYLVAFAEQEINEIALEQLELDLGRLEKGYPLAYLLGTKAFWDMDLRVTEATLIPRADTETLIEVTQTILTPNSTAHIIDLGTGSGAIAIALSRAFPNAQITATDFCDKALMVAKDNACNWQGSAITFIRNCWLDGFSQQQFDVIVSNPPYIIEGDEHLQNLTFEPIAALTSKKNGLADIETIISQSQSVLKSNGWLVLEHGHDQGQLVRDIFDTKRWHTIKTHKDLSGNERITIGQLLNPKEI